MTSKLSWKRFVLFLTVGLGLGGFSDVYSQESASTSAERAEAQDAAPVVGKIESLGVFKNGIAIVRERFDVPRSGRYFTAAPEKPLHGAFFVQSDAYVSATATNSETAVSFDKLDYIDWTKDFQGQWVDAILPGNEQPQRVRILPNPNAQSGSRAVVRPYNSYNSYAYSEEPRSNKGVLLETEEGKVVWISDASSVTSVSLADGLPREFRRKTPRLIFDVNLTKEQSERSAGATIYLSYLTRGAAWAPQYRVELQDEKTLEVEQSAVLINELCDLNDVDVTLYSGFPNILLQNSTSPMAPQVALNEFFASLNRNSSSSTVMSQMALNASMDVGMDGNSSNDASGNESSFSDGVDIFSQNVGKKTLKKGDRALFTVGKATASYNKVVRWNIMDVRDSDGRLNERNMQSGATTDVRARRYGLTTSGEEVVGGETRYQEPWDVINFDNPFDFPITTGPVAILNNGRFLGQNTFYWTNPKEKTELAITKALSVRVRSIENEREYEPENDADDAIENDANIMNQQALAVKLNKRGRQENMDRSFLTPELKPEYWGKVVYIDGVPYRVAVMEASIELKNQRSETSNVKIDRNFSGVLIPDSLDGFDEQPSTLKLGSASGASGVNPQKELHAEIALKPGETKTLKFSYQRFIRQ